MLPSEGNMRPEAIPMLYLLAGQFIEALKEKRRAEHPAPKLEVDPMVGGGSWRSGRYGC
jgi:hypothetical protein